jgi:hypothetical protein
MISDPVIAKHYHKAQRTLKSSRNKNKAMDRIIEEGISEIEAVRIVDYVYDDNIQANRKLGIYYFRIFTGICGAFRAIFSSHDYRAAPFDRR